MKILENPRKLKNSPNLLMPFYEKYNIFRNKGVGAKFYVFWSWLPITVQMNYVIQKNLLNFLVYVKKFLEVPPLCKSIFCTFSVFLV